MLAADDPASGRHLRRALAALQASRVFGALEASALGRLLDAGSPVELARGEMLVHRDD